MCHSLLQQYCRNLRASLTTAHILSALNTHRSTRVTTMSCAPQRNAEITSEAPTPSRSTSKIAQSTMTRRKAMATCDQVGGDMGEVGEGDSRRGISWVRDFSLALMCRLSCPWRRKSQHCLFMFDITKHGSARCRRVSLSASALQQLMTTSSF